MGRPRGTVGLRPDREGWWIRYFDRFGRRHQLYGGATEDDAKDELAAALRREDELAAGKMREVMLATFAADELFPLVRARLEPKSFEAFSGRVLAAAQHFGGRAMVDVSRGDGEAYLGTLRVAPATVAAYRSALSVAWKVGVRRLVARENVWIGLPVPAAHERAVRFLSEEDIDALVAKTPRRIRAFVAWQAETGMRRGESLRLRWQDVSEDRVLVVKSKTKRTREFPLTAKGAAILKGLRRGAPSHRVFRSVPVSWPKQARALWRTAKRRAGLPKDYRLHDLRHARASLLVRVRVPGPDVASWLGMSVELVYRRYGKHAPENAMDRARALLEASRQGTPPPSPGPSAGAARRGRKRSGRTPSASAPRGSRRGGTRPRPKA